MMDCNTKWIVNLLFDNGRESKDEFSDLDDALEFWSMVKHWEDVIQGSLVSMDDENGEELMQSTHRSLL